MAKEMRSHDLEKMIGEVSHELENLRQRSEAQFEQMMQLIRAISLQNQEKKETSTTVPEGEGESHLNDIRNHWGKSTRLEFSKFDGEEFDGWLIAEYFFEVAELRAEEQVKIVALHLEGKALQWHRGYVSLRKDMAYSDWDGYIQAMAARFGARAYEDPLADLRNLKQVSSLKDYMDSFDAMYPRTGIREDQALSFFLSGLVDELQMPVHMFKPKSLDDAYALAKLQEITVAALNHKPKSAHSMSYSTSYSSTVKPLTVTTSSYKPPAPNNSKDTTKSNAIVNVPKPNPRITNREMDERRSKALCFWCEEKYTPNHKCPKKRVYVMQLIEEEEGGAAQEEEEETMAELQLSLHAMWDWKGLKL